MRLFAAHDSGIRDAAETVRDAAAPQHVYDFAIRIGDNGNGVVPSYSLQSITGSWQNLIPVRRLLRIFHQSISHPIVQGVEVLQKIGVERPPETVIHAATDHPLVKFLLSPALHGVP